MARFLFLLALLPGLAQAQYPLATFEVAYRLAREGYSAEAVVEAGRTSTLASQVAGRIQMLEVDAGDAVRQGQVLVRIDDSEARNSAAGSAASVAQAEASLANAKAQYERARQLVNRQFMSAAALDKAAADYRAAEAQLAAARAGGAQSATLRRYTSIQSPLDGLVLQRHAQAGEMASLGKPLLTVFDPASVRILATIPQEKVALVRSARQVEVEVPGFAQPFVSSAFTVLPGADSRTHVSEVRIALPRAVPGLTPGLYARVYFGGEEGRKLVLPASALLRRSEMVGVYVVKGKQVRLRQVRIGRETAQGVEILAGLRAGERVAADPVKAGMYLRSRSAHE